MPLGELFAESVVVDEASCVPVRRDVPLTIASLVGCAVMTGYDAVVNRARVSPGSTVLVLGAGGVGNNVDSTREAVRAAMDDEPGLDVVRAARSDCHNPFFDARPFLDQT